MWKESGTTPRSTAAVITKSSEITATSEQAIHPCTRMWERRKKVAT
jgi:hypothetical protein